MVINVNKTDTYHSKLRVNGLHSLSFILMNMQLKIQSILKMFFMGSIFFLASQKSLSQSNAGNDKKWEDLLTQYQSGSINDTDYFKQAEILATQSFKDSALKEKLSTYKKIAWSSEDYHRYRVKYYRFLTNNATFTYKAGASIYYAEKAEEERKQIRPYMNTLTETRLLFFIYGRNSSGYPRCTTEFNRVLSFLKKLPQAILTDSVPNSTIISALAIISDQSEIYMELKDTANAFTTCALSENIWNCVKRKYEQSDVLLKQAKYLFAITKYIEVKLMHKPVDAKKMLDTAYKSLTTLNNPGNAIWRQAATDDLLLKYFNFFIDQKQTDSAAFYLNKLKNQQDSSVAEYSDGTVFLLNDSKLKAALGDYKTAYENTLKAYEINDSVIGVKTADITNNMYAQTVAENKSEALQKSEAKEYKRNITIGIISVVSLIAIIILYLQMRKKERELKERIYKLNYASQLQIMELEEKNLLVKKEEQRRLGMDLHDNLAGTIAAIKVKVETELINNPSPEQAERLKTISNLITAIYEKTRNKSHELYHGWENESEVSFSKRIKLITDNSFASNKYKTTIDVDDELMAEINLPIKIQMLYIVQEAVTNIIKHSSANKISILVYEDVSGLVMQITDNGKGFNPTNKKGIGLSSIRERAAAVHGTVEILSDNKGTEITVTIPVLFESELSE